MCKHNLNACPWITALKHDVIANLHSLSTPQCCNMENASAIATQSYKILRLVCATKINYTESLSGHCASVEAMFQPL